MSKVMCCVTSIMVVVMLMGFSIGVVQADNCVLPVFDVANFTSQNDNPYLSTDNIGYTYVYEAETEDGLIRDYIYFSEDTVNILGVECTVVYDVEYLFVEDLGVSGEWVLLEETWDWHAWDQFGNFWYFGEDTVAYEWDEDWGDCETSTEGAWKAGVNGAEAGIILPFDPNQGDCFYEEYYEGEAEDQVRVMKLNAKVSWALGECEDCGKFKEWTKLDPGNIEHKYYAPGLGLVYIEELKEKTVISELADHYPGGPDLTGMDLYSVPCYEPLP